MCVLLNACKWIRVLVNGRKVKYRREMKWSDEMKATDRHKQRHTAQSVSVMDPKHVKSCCRYHYPADNDVGTKHENNAAPSFTGYMGWTLVLRGSEKHTLHTLLCSDAVVVQ